MTTKEWLNTESALQPDTELFRSGRRFVLCAYADSHGQLLLRSHADLDRSGGPTNTTIDLLFKPAGLLKIRDVYDGLVIRCATAQEAEGIRTTHPSFRFSRDDRVFMLESKGEIDYVVAMAVGWREGVLSPTQQSFFNDIDAGRPRWPSQPLFSAGPGFNLTSARAMIAPEVADCWIETLPIAL